MNHPAVIVLWVLTGFAFLVGCQRAPAPGGDSPVTTQKLTGSRLTDLREDLSWTFDDTTVVIENNTQPIQSDVVQELLGNHAAPRRIEAAWRYDRNTGMLRLRNATADGEEIATEMVIPVKSAGHVRVNLGGRQYNLFRINTKAP